MENTLEKKLAELQKLCSTNDEFIRTVADCISNGSAMYEDGGYPTHDEFLPEVESALHAAIRHREIHEWSNS